MEVYAESLAPSDSASTVTCVEHLLGSLRVVLANAWTVARRGVAHNGGNQPIVTMETVSTAHRLQKQ